MRLLSQNIAQRANKEDGEVGKFFQVRYRAVRLLDETAILACAGANVPGENVPPTNGVVQANFAFLRP